MSDGVDEKTDKDGGNSSKLDERIVNESDLDWTVTERGDSEFKRKKLGKNGDKLGCSLYVVPSTKRSWPYHYHTENEEAIYVLSGEGEIRIGGERRDIEEDDYVSLPSNEEGAHQVINTSESELRYLVFSTMNQPDVTVYPDSEKIGVFAGSPPGSDDERSVHGYYRIDDDVDYWEDELD